MSDVPGDGSVHYHDRALITDQIKIGTGFDHEGLQDHIVLVFGSDENSYVVGIPPEAAVWLVLSLTNVVSERGLGDARDE